MALVRWEDRTWDPFREFEEMSSRLSRMLARPMFSASGDILPTTEWIPSVNIAETDKLYSLSVELPQVKREDVHVTVEGSTLMIEGERKHEKEEKGTTYHRVESFYGKFLRRFTLPEDVEAAKLDASFRDGMLHISIPKMASKKQPALEVKIH